MLWAPLHDTGGVVRIQALARGFLLRTRLALAGPGVLRRAIVSNDEDLFTCESKDRHHPLSYVAFEEAGKIWWFDAESLWGWMSRSVVPVNPYTKTPIPVEARTRLRGIQRRDGFSYGANTLEDGMARRWNVLAHVFRENGFRDSHPNHFTNYDSEDYSTMFVFLERDLRIALPETDIHREKLLRICRQGQAGAHSDIYPMSCTTLLLRMLSIPRDPHVLVFSILASFTRC